MAASPTTATRALLIDALGTLIQLDDPSPRLAAALGVKDAGEVAQAVRKEMAFYREHAHEGTDAESLTALRARCAEILSWELNREVSVEVMMDSIRFSAFDDALPALEAVRGAGLGVVCVSNWDYSLPSVLERCGVAALVDSVVTSAEVGAGKPDPAIFAAGLERAKCGPGEAVHVGDTHDEDIAGARAAGIAALLIDRSGGGDIASLVEIGGAIGLG